MTSATTESPSLLSVASFGATSLRRSYNCYNCNYSFHISPTANTSTYPSSFRCPQCHHRHLIPHHTISPRALPSAAPPARDNRFSPVITSFYYETSDDDDDDDDNGNDLDHPHIPFTVPYAHHSTPALKSVVDSLMVVRFPSNSAQSCPICIEDFDVNPDASATINELPCKHCFHTDCIVEWLQMSNTCPLCRHKLRSNRTPEEEVNRRGATELEVGLRYDAFSVFDFYPVRERRPLRRISGSNAAVSGRDRRVFSWEIDPMHDADGDTLMIDA